LGRIGRWTAGVLGGALTLVSVACGAASPSAPTTSMPPRAIDGIVTTVAGQMGDCSIVDGDRGSARLGRPDAIVADGTGGLYVIDGRDGVIRRVRPDGSMSTLIGAAGEPGLVDGTAPAARLAFAGSEAGIDASGALWFTDLHDNVVRRLDPDGTLSTVGIPWIGSFDLDELERAGPADQVRFISPFGLAVSGGDVLVADEITQSVRRIRDGSVSVLWSDVRGHWEPVGTGSMARAPLGIAAGSDGSIWVHDGGTAVYRLSASGDLTLVAGLPGTTGAVDGPGPEARFADLAGMAVGPDGAAYVSDDGTVRRIDPDGTVTTLAGVAGSYGAVDGRGDTAQLGRWSTLAFGDDGALYAADTEGCVIRRIT
jgi:streptogramin lyase